MGEIPKTFHFIWLGGPMPEHLEQYVDTWRERHQSWVFNVWTEDQIAELFNQEIYDNAAELVGAQSQWQLKSDVARYEILAEYGGVYVDCDFECRRPIDDVIRPARCFAAWEAPGRWINNAIMGAVPRHPLVERLVERLADSVKRRRPNYRPNRISGPQYITPLWAGQEDLLVLPQRWFYPYSFNELHRQGEDFPDCYAIHHWHNTRLRHANTHH